jgi:anti-anti-sigma factor
MIAERPSPATFSGFEAQLRAEGEPALLRLRGEIDLAVEAAMRDAIGALLASGARTAVIDLGGVAYMDSTGVQLLLAAQARADGTGRRLLLRLGAPARRVLLLCGVLGRFTVTS